MRHEVRCTIWNFSKFSTPHSGCLFQTFRWDLKQDICYLIWNVWNCSNTSQELLIQNFLMRLEKRCDIWNLWNFKLFNPSQGLLIWNFHMKLGIRFTIWNLTLFTHIMRALAYLKISDKIWNEMCHLKLLKPETFQELLIWIWDLKLFKLLNPSQRLLIWNFQMSLERKCDIWNLQTFQLSQGLLIWNFQKRPEIRFAIWNFLNLKLWSIL